MRELAGCRGVSPDIGSKAVSAERSATAAVGVGQVPVDPLGHGVVDVAQAPELLAHIIDVVVQVRVHTLFDHPPGGVVEHHTLLVDPVVAAHRGVETLDRPPAQGVVAVRRHGDLWAVLGSWVVARVGEIVWAISPQSTLNRANWKGCTRDCAIGCRATVNRPDTSRPGPTSRARARWSATSGSAGCSGTTNIPAASTQSVRTAV